MAERQDKPTPWEVFRSHFSDICSAITSSFDRTADDLVTEKLIPLSIYDDVTTTTSYSTYQKGSKIVRELHNQIQSSKDPGQTLLNICKVLLRQDNQKLKDIGADMKRQLTGIVTNNAVKMTTPSTTIPQTSIMREEYIDFHDVGITSAVSSYKDNKEPSSNDSAKKKSTTSAVSSYEDNEEPSSNDSAKKKSCWQLMMIIILGLGVTFLALLFSYLINAFGENTRWHCLEEYLLVIVWNAPGVIVAAVIFWCVICVFGDNSWYKLFPILLFAHVLVVIDRQISNKDENKLVKKIIENISTALFSTFFTLLCQAFGVKLNK